jgi:hypothetical protein
VRCGIFLVLIVTGIYTPHLCPFVSGSVDITRLRATVAAKRSSRRSYLLGKHDRPYDRSNGKGAHNRPDIEPSGQGWLACDPRHKLRLYAPKFVRSIDPYWFAPAAHNTARPGLTPRALWLPNPHLLPSVLLPLTWSPIAIPLREGRAWIRYGECDAGRFRCNSLFDDLRSSGIWGHVSAEKGRRPSFTGGPECARCFIGARHYGCFGRAGRPTRQPNCPIRHFRSAIKRVTRRR